MSAARYEFAVIEMDQFDSLSPEMRAAVREFGHNPYHGQSVEDYIAEETRIRRESHERAFIGIEKYLV